MITIGEYPRSGYDVELYPEDTRTTTYIIGSPDCLHGDTPIYDPIDRTTMTVRERWLDGSEFHVVSMDADGLPVIAKSMPPRQFPVSDMVKVYFSTGESITVTPGHRFLTQLGYVSVEHLDVFGQQPLSNVDIHLPTISGSDLSKSLGGAQHLREIDGGSPDDYQSDLHLYGPQLRSVGDTGQLPFPSLDGAQGHTLALSCRGEKGQGLDDTLSTLWYRLSSEDCLSRLCRSSRGVYQYQTTSDTSQRWPSCPSTEPLLCSREDRIGTEPQQPGFFHPSSFLGCASYVNTTYLDGTHGQDECQVSRIVGAGCDYYYDFHVPVYNNYWACGVFHHNSGKSTLIGELIEQYSQAGEGCLVLDIKGDLARDIASRTKTPDNLVYVKMGGIAYPDGMRYWTLNPFEGHRDNTVKMRQIKESVVESFELMGYADLQSNANIRDTLRNTVDIALTLEKPTYLDLFVMLMKTDYVEELLRTQGYIPPMARAVWEELLSMKDFERRSKTGTARNRLSAFLDNPDVNLAVGTYESTIKLAEWLDEGKLVVVDLGPPLTEPAGEVLGNMLMAHLLTAIKLRPPQRDRTWRIAVDEFHKFVGRAFIEIITYCRSYNAFLVLAHQDRNQFEGDVGRKVLGAVGHSNITFNLRGSREDRVALASLYGIDQVDQYLDLPQYTAIVEYRDGLTGNKNREPILLRDWQRPEVAGQLPDAQMAVHSQTVDEATLKHNNYKRYFDLLDGKPNRDRLNSNGNTQSKTKSKPEVRRQPNPKPKASQPASEETPQSPRPGRRGPARALDQLDDSGSLLPRPPAKD